MRINGDDCRLREVDLSDPIAVVLANLSQYDQWQKLAAEIIESLQNRLMEEQKIIKQQNKEIEILKEVLEYDKMKRAITVVKKELSLDSIGDVGLLKLKLSKIKK